MLNVFLNKRSRSVYLRFILIITAFVAFGCGGGGEDSSNNTPAGYTGVIDISDPISVEVSSTNGGVITDRTGTTLEIPPGALSEDTVITLKTAQGDNGLNLFVSGAICEPDGLVLNSPATIRFPLPDEWDGSEDPEVYYAKGSDPMNVIPTGNRATVTGASGSYIAEIELTHFCVLLLSKTCYAGALKQLLLNFESRGCPREMIFDMINSRYPGLNVNENHCANALAPHIQAFLDTFFDDIGGWNKGMDVDQDIIDGIIQYAKDGRQVALAFFNDSSGQRQGLPNRFFEPNNFKHVAVLEKDEFGKIQIYNTSPNRNADLVREIGPEITFNYPLEPPGINEECGYGVNKFRNLPQGVALECDVCGKPNCLANSSENSYGIAPYEPIEGGDKLHAASRMGKWTAVRIYVERTFGPPYDPCSLLATKIDADIPGFYPNDFIPGFVQGAPAEGGGIVIEGTDDLHIPGIGMTSDWISIVICPNINTPGIYPLKTSCDSSTPSASIYFEIPLGEDERDYIVKSTSGYISLLFCNQSVGGRVKGYFNCDVEVIGPNLYTTFGNMNGSFDVLLQEYIYAATN
jgi:hypothetical protein